jgi:hypothetical protein
MKKMASDAHAETLSQCRDLKIAIYKRPMFFDQHGNFERL